MQITQITLILVIALSLVSSVLADTIAFVENGEIYTAVIDSRDNIRDIRKITNRPRSDSDPVWSPDGRKIGFLSYRDGFFTAYIMDLQSMNPRPLNKKIKKASDLNWYSDGRKILLEGEIEDERRLFIVGINGEILDEISFTGLYGVFRLSPDDKHIACHDMVNHNISIINTSNWEVRGITGRDEWGNVVDWLNEEVIAFSRLEGGEYMIVLLSIDGRVIRKYALPGFIDANYPACSPDGKRIMFVGSEKKGKWFLYVLDLNTGRIKNTGVEGGRPDWWGEYTAVKPLNLLNTFWSLIKANEVRR